MLGGEAGQLEGGVVSVEVITNECAYNLRRRHSLQIHKEQSIKHCLLGANEPEVGEAFFDLAYAWSCTESKLNRQSGYLKSTKKATRSGIAHMP